MNLSQTTLQYATKLVVIGEGIIIQTLWHLTHIITLDQSIEIVDLRRNNAENEVQFTYRKFKFIYSHERYMFVPVQFDLSGHTMKQIHNDFGEGLSDNAAADNQKYYGKSDV